MTAYVTLAYEKFYLAYGEQRDPVAAIAKDLLALDSHGKHELTERDAQIMAEAMWQEAQTNVEAA